MGLLKKLIGRLGYQWSLYISRDNKQLVWAMHGESPIEILGHVMLNFANGGTPVEPWELHLNFNPSGKYFKLGPEHLSADGASFTRQLIEQIEAIDPDWQRGPGRGLMFVEAATKKELVISENLSFDELVERAHSDQPREKTFHDVMRIVFGKN